MSHRSKGAVLLWGSDVLIFLTGFREKKALWTTLVVQRLGLHATTAGGVGLTPGQGINNIAHAMR